jgi:hypothetical protein
MWSQIFAAASGGKLVLIVTSFATFVAPHPHGPSDGPAASQTRPRKYGYGTHMSTADRNALILATLAASLEIAIPRVASAAQSASIAPGTHTYRTAFAPQYVGGGEYDGVLRLRVAPDGAITGYFRNEDADTFRDVVGGVSGSHVWLDLGPGLAAPPIEAMVRDGKIVGGTYAAGQPYSFVATPDDASGLAGSP